mgnify:CR=1 FL=1
MALSVAMAGTARQCGTVYGAPAIHRFNIPDRTAPVLTSIKSYRHIRTVNLSVSPSRFYVERFGTILHHNVDKALLCCARRSPRSRTGTSNARARFGAR